MMLSFGVLMVPLLFLACGKPFNVQPKPKVMTANYSVSAVSNGVSISAEAVTDEDHLYTTFEANLILAGILPVQVKLANTNNEPVELKNTRFGVKAQNQTFKSTDAKSVYKRLMNFYSISIYNKAGYKESREDFTAYEINIKNPLAPNNEREGLLFFALPNDIIKSGDLTLMVEKLNGKKANDAPPVELKLK